DRELRLRVSLEQANFLELVVLVRTICTCTRSNVTKAFLDILFDVHPSEVAVSALLLCQDLPINRALCNVMSQRVVPSRQAPRVKEFRYAFAIDNPVVVLCRRHKRHAELTLSTVLTVLLEYLPGVLARETFEVCKLLMQCVVRVFFCAHFAAVKHNKTWALQKLSQVFELLRRIRSRRKHLYERLFSRTLHACTQGFRSLGSRFLADDIDVISDAIEVNKDVPPLPAEHLFYCMAKTCTSAESASFVVQRTPLIVLMHLLRCLRRYTSDKRISLVLLRAIRDRLRQVRRVLTRDPLMTPATLSLLLPMRTQLLQVEARTRKSRCPFGSHTVQVMNELLQAHHQCAALVLGQLCPQLYGFPAQVLAEFLLPCAWFTHLR
ncbi:MAG: hypothetical protein MHM6MM_004193, partial [Cercozoa sp. M6MM]